jgi:hypothetical protein
MPHSSELVISRFCEDLSWVHELGLSFDTVTIYDKSPAGGRDRIHLGGWSSADGPDQAGLWPGAIALPNVGCESHTHMHHITEKWGHLADTTVFLSGDAPVHFPDVVPETARYLSMPDVAYAPYGELYSCDKDGKPHVDRPFPELAEGWQLFFPNEPMPDTLTWHGTGMYLVSRKRIERWDLKTWIAAREWCQRKIHSLAMERLYDTMFS